MASHSKLIAGVEELRGASMAELKDARWMANLIRSVGLFGGSNWGWVAECDRAYINEDDGLLQVPEQLAGVLVFLSEFRIGSYLEVGTHAGWTATVISTYLSRFNREFGALAIDITNRFRAYHEIRKELPFLEFAIADSDSIRGESFDLVFIDADHSYDGVERDYQHVGRHARLCMFHDINDRYVPKAHACGGSVRWWRERKPVLGETREFTAHPSGAEIMGIGLVVGPDAIRRVDEAAEGEIASGELRLGASDRPQQVRGRVARHASKSAKAAIFTICRNEDVFLPMWVEYYRRHFAREDVYILDSETDDGSIETVVEHVSAVKPVRCSRVECVPEMLAHVHEFQRALLREYDVVVFTEIDEFLVPEGIALGDYLEIFARHDRAAETARGYNITTDESVWPEGKLERDTLEAVVCDRAQAHPDRMYDKTLISKVPLDWTPGFHGASIQSEPDALCLLHLHYIDPRTAHRRVNRRVGRGILDEETSFGFQNKELGYERQVHHFEAVRASPSVPIMSMELVFGGDSSGEVSRSR